MRLYPIHGGLRLPAHKAESANGPIVHCPLPPRLVVPLLQHNGAAARPVVRVGEQVLAGQLLGAADGARGAAVHSPAAGTVLEVAPHAVAHPSGLPVACVSIACSASQPAHRLTPISDWEDREPASLRQRIRDAGVVGMGGAAFPTADKLDGAPDLLILNGAECEPWIACDDRLLRERAAEVIAGGRLLQRASGAQRVLLAIEDSMHEALAAIRAALSAATGVEVVAVPSVYPQGGERQLIQTLCGREVPSGGLPRDIGVLVCNVATAAASWRAVVHGETLTRRIVSVTGRGVARPGNFDAAIGTPISHLIEAAGGYTAGAARLLHGGPLMGFALPHDELPIGKDSNCLLVLDAEQIRDTAPERPCIRCGACAEACPARLLPQQLLTFSQSGQWQRLRAHGLAACIECGCCDLVCPSHIPLVEHFRYAKSALRLQQKELAGSEAARQRFEARGERQRRLEDERASRQAAQQDSTSPEAVQAAIARAQARRLPGAAK